MKVRRISLRPVHVGKSLGAVSAILLLLAPCWHLCVWAYSPAQATASVKALDQYSTRIAQAEPPASYIERSCPLLPACPGGPPVPLPPGAAPDSRTGSTDGTIPPPLAGSQGIREGRGKYAGMVRIPAGYADIGSIEPEGRPDEWPRHRVYLDQFHIAKREVTVEQYCLFLNEYGMLGRDGRPRVNLGHPSCPLIKRGKNYLPKPDMAERPMVCVSWYGALAFARAAGGRLPTAAEWEKAAIFTVPNPPGDYLASLGRTESVPVAIAQPGVLGMRGLVGNVWEWCSDWYAADYYAASPAANPVGPPLGKEKELRGGSWASAETSKRIKNRHKAPAPAYFRTVGFRVVKD